jgi:hypothetical protein
MRTLYKRRNLDAPFPRCWLEKETEARRKLPVGLRASGLVQCSVALAVAEASNIGPAVASVSSASARIADQ